MAKTSKSSDPADWSPDSPRWRRSSHHQPADEGGRAARLLAVVSGALAAGVIISLLSLITEVPRGRGIVWLELAGTTERARLWLEAQPSNDHVSIPEIHHALLADLLLIAFYVIGLFIVTQYLGERGFRIGQWRRAARSMRWV